MLSYYEIVGTENCAAELMLLRTPMTEIKANRDSWWSSSTQTLRETTRRMSRFRSRLPRSRPRKKFKHAANATATVPDAIRRRATGLTLFPLLVLSLFGRLAQRTEERRTIEGKNQFHMKLNRQPRYSNSSRETSRVSAFHTSGKLPNRFRSWTSLLCIWWQSRAASMFSYFSNVFLFNVRKYRKMLRYTRVLRLASIESTLRRFSLHFWIKLICVGLFEYNVYVGT